MKLLNSTGSDKTYTYDGYELYLPSGEEKHVQDDVCMNFRNNTELDADIASDEVSIAVD